jgi:hypothetical protein
MYTQNVINNEFIINHEIRKNMKKKLYDKRSFDYILFFLLLFYY